jgi:hypothetical protein
MKALFILNDWNEKFTSLSTAERAVMVTLYTFVLEAPIWHFGRSNPYGGSPPPPPTTDVFLLTRFDSALK